MASGMTFKGGTPAANGFGGGGKSRVSTLSGGQDVSPGAVQSRGRAVQLSLAKGTVDPENAVFARAGLQRRGKFENYGKRRSR